MRKKDIETLVKENPELALQLWMWFGELGRIAFNSSYPLGSAYIDARVRRNATDKFYTYLDNALGEAKPEIRGMYRADIKAKYPMV